SNDFVLSEGGRRIEVLNRDIEDWRITFVDTGLHTSIGGRLLAVRRFLEDEEVFLANYSDGLSDVRLDAMEDDFRRKDVIASFLSVRSLQSFHAVRSDPSGHVTEFGDGSDYWINGGYFILRREI